MVITAQHVETVLRIMPIRLSPNAFSAIMTLQAPRCPCVRAITYAEMRGELSCP